MPKFLKKDVPFMLIVILIMAACSASRNTSTSFNKSNILKWFNGKEYLDGLQLEPHPSVNKLEFMKQYNANKELWSKAFTYLKITDLKTLQKGKYILEPDKIIVSVTEDSTKNPETTAFESHRKFIDLQYIISGEEKIGVAPSATATIVNPYDDAKDVANYSAEGKYYTSEPGKFFLFFPSDAHRPGITTSNNQPDKKIVIKIAVAQ